MLLPKKPALPPGPRRGTDEELGRFITDAYGYLEELAAAHGPLFTLRLGSLGNPELPHIDSNGAWVFLTRPHQIKAMYEAGDEQASGALANKVFFGTDEASVAYIDGTAHRRRRAQLHPAFNGGRDYSRLVLDQLAARAAGWPAGEAFPLFTELQLVTAAVITRVVCGNLPESDQQWLRTMLLHTENAERSREELFAADAAIRSFIAERIAGHPFRTGQDDVLGTLLRLAADGDESLSAEVIRDEVFGLLYTGFSTTANTLSWALVRILDDERVRGRLRAELAEVLGDRPVSRESLNELAYLDATIKETLRLHPVTPLNGVRLLHRPMVLDGYRIPAGTILVHCAHLLHRSPEVFSDPDSFRPERFLGGGVDSYRFGPFGGGHRMCVGRGFSLGEMKAALCWLLTENRLERTAGVPKAKLQGFFMAPADHAMATWRPSTADD